MAPAAPRPRAMLPTAATDALRVYFLFALWVLNATSLTMVVARRACGAGSRAAAAAERACLAAMWAAGVLAPFGAPPLLRKYQSLLQTRRRQRQIWGAPNARRRQPGTSEGRPRDVALLFVMLSLILVVLGRLLQGLAPSKRSYQHRLGSAICDMANLFNAVVMCFILLPTLIIEMWDTPM